LGFRINIDQIEEGEFISHLLGIDNVIVRTIKLNDSLGGTIELLHFKSPDLSEQETGILQPTSYGITHIALQVEFIFDKVEMLGDYGYTPISVPKHSVDGRAIVCYLRGPEGVLFELVEITHQDLNDKRVN